MKQPTLAQFKAWAKAHSSLAMAVLEARAFAQIERERVDAYIKPVFDLFDFYVKPEWRKGEPGQTFGQDWRVLEQKHLYMSDQEALCDQFYEECDKEHRKHGFKGPHGYCPALMAENLVIEAEKALIQSAGPLFGQDLNCYGDLRQKLLDTLIGACVLDQRKAA